MSAESVTTHIPDYFKGPITRITMLDPVTVYPCGHKFERSALEIWMNQGHPCPFDQRLIEQMTPDDTLRNEIHVFILNHPELFENKTVEELLAENQANYDELEANLNPDQVFAALQADRVRNQHAHEGLMQEYGRLQADQNRLQNNCNALQADQNRLLRDYETLEDVQRQLTHLRRIAKMERTYDLILSNESYIRLKNKYRSLTNLERSQTPETLQHQEKLKCLAKLVRNYDLRLTEANYAKLDQEETHLSEATKLRQEKTRISQAVTRLALEVTSNSQEQERVIHEARRRQQEADERIYPALREHLVERETAARARMDVVIAELHAMALHDGEVARKIQLMIISGVVVGVAFGPYQFKCVETG